MAPSPFHRDLRFARLLPRTIVGPRTLPLSRRFDERTAAKRPANVEIIDDGPVAGRLHRPSTPADRPGRAVLWIHGGGYVLGTPAMDDPVCRFLADGLGVPVLAAGYRRAPEHPFPTPLHDCHDALVRLAERDDVDASRIAIAGASAGGGLAAALAFLARERGDVDVAFQLLTYPMLDDRTVLRPIDDRHTRLWTNKSNRYGWASYLAASPGSADIDPIAVPARRDDLEGLPPAWIGVGTVDLFMDEDLAYAERLRAAGVPCDVELVEGAFHGFDSTHPKAGVTKRFRTAQLEALRNGLGLAAPTTA